MATTTKKRAPSPAKAAHTSAPAAESTSNGSEPEKSSVRFDGFMARDEAVSYFEALVRGLKKGTLHLKQGDGSLTLSPQPNIEVEVKASRKKNKEGISFELSWKLPGESDLTITSE